MNGCGHPVRLFTPSCHAPSLSLGRIAGVPGPQFTLPVSQCYDSTWARPVGDRCCHHLSAFNTVISVGQGPSVPPAPVSSGSMRPGLAPSSTLHLVQAPAWLPLPQGSKPPSLVSVGLISPSNPMALSRARPGAVCRASRLPHQPPDCASPCPPPAGPSRDRRCLPVPHASHAHTR